MNIHLLIPGVLLSPQETFIFAVGMAVDLLQKS